MLAADQPLRSSCSTCCGSWLACATIQNLQTAGQNLSASRSRIQDADFAAETANLSRAQVLQQAGTAIVAQANQLPQQVLQLLR